MKTYTDKQLKKLAKSDYLDCRECGHYPEAITDAPYISEASYEKYANDMDMSIKDYETYLKYFTELCG